MAKKRVKLGDQIRQAVETSGLSRYRMAKLLGISESSMSRFMNGQGLSLEVLDRLAELLEMNLEPIKEKSLADLRALADQNCKPRGRPSRKG